MMTCEKGLQKHITFDKDTHVMELLDDHARVREEIAEAQAPVTYLDYQQTNQYISRFFQARNTKDRNFYMRKLLDIRNTYGQWLDPKCLDKLNKALRTVI